VLSTTTGYPGPLGDYGECDKVHLFAPGQTADTHLCLAGSVALNSAIGLPPIVSTSALQDAIACTQQHTDWPAYVHFCIYSVQAAVCVPEECQPADLEGEELREWLMLQHARIEGDNTATPTQLHYLQNLVEIGEVARNTWTGKSQC
jgi:hypothetical protein